MHSSYSLWETPRYRWHTYDHRAYRNPALHRQPPHGHCKFLRDICSRTNHLEHKQVPIKPVTCTTSITKDHVFPFYYISDPKEGLKAKPQLLNTLNPYYKHHNQGHCFLNSRSMQKKCIYMSSGHSYCGGSWAERRSGSQRGLALRKTGRVDDMLGK